MRTRLQVAYGWALGTFQDFHISNSINSEIGNDEKRTDAQCQSHSFLPKEKENPKPKQPRTAGTHNHVPRDTCANAVSVPRPHGFRGQPGRATRLTPAQSHLVLFLPLPSLAGAREPGGQRLPFQHICTRCLPAKQMGARPHPVGAAPPGNSAHLPL